MDITQLQKLARLVRYYILLSTTKAGSGHPSSSLSATDLLTVLFFKYLRFDLRHPDNPANDRVIFSKGHASPLFYALYTAAGVISESEITTLRQFDSVLEGHPTPRFTYTEAATGSLGQGLSVGVGMALALRALENKEIPQQVRSSHLAKSVRDDTSALKSLADVSNSKRYTLNAVPSVYVLLGDGEMLEGSVWEAIQVAAHYKLDNLIGILDVNRLSQSQATMYGHDVTAYETRIKAFGWNTIVVDGHNLKEIDEVLSTISCTRGSCHSTAPAPPTRGPRRWGSPSRVTRAECDCDCDCQPTMIIAKTVKGKGVSLIEDKDGWHGKALKPEEFQKAVGELGQIDFKLRGMIQKPVASSKYLVARIKKNANYKLLTTNYKVGESIATRQAYGKALARLGQVYPNVVALDSDVKNSTYSEIFKAAYPERFFEMFIAEQNMVGAAVGMARLGWIPFASTFACFLTRAFDQIRMAALSKANIKLVGSHAGVSIGEDGPSQMGLEDFAMFRAVSGSVVLHPADAVATEKLVEEMITHKGLVYMRTSRPTTPVIYSPEENFVIGGSKVFEGGPSTLPPIINNSNEGGIARDDKPDEEIISGLSNKKLITIVATGVTVHEALKAQKRLKSDGIAVRVIDCYCLKPIDSKTLINAANASKALIVVEDHWVEGGLGDAVLEVLASETHPPVYKLAVSQMPRSGKPAELLDWAGISAGKIVEFVRKLPASLK